MKTMRDSAANRLPKLFFSHSEKDKALLSELVEVARTGLNLSDGDIRCSSLDGYGFAAGTDIVARAKDDGLNSNSLIGVITPCSIQSNWVLFELGARWGTEKHFIIILANGAKVEDLPGPLRNRLAKQCVESDLESLFLDVADELNISFRAPAARKHLKAAELLSRAAAQRHFDAKHQKRVDMVIPNATARVEFSMPTDESIVETEFGYEANLTVPPKPEHSLWLCHEVSGELWFKSKKPMEFNGQVAKGSLKEGGTPRDGAFSLVVVELNKEGEVEVQEWFRNGEDGKGYPGFTTVQGAKVAEIRLTLRKIGS